MTPPPDLPALDGAAKDALILSLMARFDRLEAENADLRAENARLRERLGLPPRTPDNSSLPPSQGRKASTGTAEGHKRKPHEGAHRPLHPNPTERREVRAASCGHCGWDVSGVAQTVVEAYDRIEIPPIAPQVIRVGLHGGVCPCCARRFKASPPPGLEAGSPFGPNLRALVVYLRFTQAIGFERLARLLSDLVGLAISEGALVGLLASSRQEFARQAGLIRARLLSSSVLESDETGLRVGKKNWWLWVFHHRDSAAFVAEPARAKSVPEGLP